MKAWLFAKDKHDIFQTNEPLPLCCRMRKKKKKKKHMKIQPLETGAAIFI